MLVAVIALLTSAAASAATPGAILGPGDFVSVRVLHVPETGDKPFRIDETGALELPMAGRVPAAGLTASELAARLQVAFAPYVREPRVTVELAERKSRPVSVLGAVKSPGVYQLQGEQRLLEVLSLAGGLTDDAGGTVILTRNEGGKQVRREIDLEELMAARDPSLDAAIRPRDVITAPRGKFVYVAGEVRRPGGFPVRSAQGLSVLQAMSLSEGLTATASAKDARIVRPGPGGAPTEIPVNVRDILAGKDSGAALLPGDVLFVPSSASRKTAIRTLDTVLQMATGMVVFRR